MAILKDNEIEADLFQFVATAPATQRRILPDTEDQSRRSPPRSAASWFILQFNVAELRRVFTEPLDDWNHEQEDARTLTGYVRWLTAMTRDGEISGSTRLHCANQLHTLRMMAAQTYEPYRRSRDGQEPERGKDDPAFVGRFATGKAKVG